MGRGQLQQVWWGRGRCQHEIQVFGLSQLQNVTPGEGAARGGRLFWSFGG